MLAPVSGYSDPPVSHPGQENFQKALSAMNDGSFAEAEEGFKQAILLEPNNPEYHFELANLYALERDESQKIKDFAGADQKLQAAAGELKQAMMMKPDFLAAHFNLGVVYKKMERYEEARQEFKEVLKLDPAQSPARLQIGTTYEEQGFYDEAEAIYRELQERYPGHPELQKMLQGLAQQREKARQVELMERNARQSVFQNGLSSLTRDAQQHKSS